MKNLMTVWRQFSTQTTPLPLQESNRKLIIARQRFLDFVKVVVIANLQIHIHTRTVVDVCLLMVGVLSELLPRLISLSKILESYDKRGTKGSMDGWGGGRREVKVQWCEATDALHWTLITTFRFSWLLLLAVDNNLVV